MRVKIFNWICLIFAVVLCVIANEVGGTVIISIIIIIIIVPETK